jgi:MFS family permease
MGPVTLTIVGDIFTIEERGRVQGFFGAVWGISAIVGPLLGGAIVSVASWRWVFWINVPFGLASMIALMKVFHEAPRARSEHPFDWAGAFVLTLGSTLLLVGASRVRPEVTLPLGVALLVLFAWIEHRAVDPVLPLDLALERPIFVAAISSVLLGAAMMGILTYVPLHAQGVLGRTPTEAGASVAPMLVGWPIASAATSRLLMRTGFRAPVWLGAFFCGGALAFFAWEVGPHVTLFGTQAAMFVYGMGMGLTNTALIIAVQSSVQWKQRGVATAMNLFARSMGQTLGVGALGSILAVSLTGALAPEAINRLLEPHVEKGTTVAAGEALAALERGLEPMFWWIALFGLLNVVVVAFYPRHQAVVADAKPTPEPHV